MGYSLIVISFKLPMLVTDDQAIVLLNACTNLCELRTKFGEFLHFRPRGFTQSSYQYPSLKNVRICNTYLENFEIFIFSSIHNSLTNEVNAARRRKLILLLVNYNWTCGWDLEKKCDVKIWAWLIDGRLACFFTRSQQVVECWGRTSSFPCISPDRWTSCWLSQRDRAPARPWCAPSLAAYPLPPEAEL